MAIQYKFVNGMGEEDHEKRIMEAVADGWLPKMMTSNPTAKGVSDNETVMVLMEKLIAEP